MIVSLPRAPAHTPDCSGIPPERDDDLDSYALCPATGPADCSDQRAFIYPGAPERCNGMDEDWDGIADNGNPGGGEACTVEGEQGACAEGTTRCENAAVVCEQTVFPTTELCDSSDNDCDGHTDENWLFGGYLPPVNTDGSSIFKWKRTVPFKFQLTNCAGEFVSTASPTIAVYFYSQGIVGDELEDVQSSGNANTGINYRYDAASHQYIYNLDTRLLPPNNSYVVRTTINDGTPEGVSTHDVIISIRR